MSDNELHALIALLDDPDQEVFNAVSENIINHGLSVVSMLEKTWESSSSELAQRRIESLIHTIQLNGTVYNLKGWVKSGAVDMLEGAFFLSLYQYPDALYSNLEKVIDRIRKDVWIELNENLTAMEKVKILNHIFYDIHGFSSNTSNFFAPQNCYVTQVAESKKGGPISLAILYSTVAQRLGLPIYTVNLPKNFILAFKDRFRTVTSEDPKDSILFYINPFNRGSILGRREIEHFLNQQNIEAKDEFFLPCSNKVTLSQLISTLIYSYEKVGNQEKISDLEMLSRLLSDENNLIE